jgi:hypothetical protein
MFEVFLILVGAFYLFAGGIAARAHLTGAVIDTVIRAIGARSMTRAEMGRLVWLLLGAFWVSFAGLFALLQLRAFIADGIVTVAIPWNTFQSNTLEAFNAAPGLQQALALLIPLCGLGYLAIRGWQVMHWPNAESRPNSNATRDELITSDAVGANAIEEQVDVAQDDTLQVTIRPSWNEGGLFNTETGESIDQPEQRLGISEAQLDLVSDWLCLWREHADPADPRFSSQAYA